MCLGNKNPAIAFGTYQRVRSFVTFHGIFMGPGYDLGERSIWRRYLLEMKCETLSLISGVY